MHGAGTEKRQGRTLSLPRYAVGRLTPRAKVLSSVISLSSPRVMASRRTAISLVLCALILWAALPVFVESPDWILVLTVNSGTSGEYPTELACFTLELRNRGPWPISVEIAELQFYPSLTGPSVTVKWAGHPPEKSLVLMPFTGNTYTFSIGLLAGLGGPDRIYAIMGANVVVLYVPRHVVLHSGLR